MGCAHEEGAGGRVGVEGRAYISRPEMFWGNTLRCLSQLLNVMPVPQLFEHAADLPILSPTLESWMAARLYLRSETRKH